jgi:hypothetical protein
VVPAGEAACGCASYDVKMEIGNSKLENRTSNQTDSISSHGACL